MSVNLIVLVGFLLLMLFVGYLANRKNKKNDIAEYFLVSRSLGIFLCVGTFGATFLGAGSFIGNTGMIYSNGLPFVLLMICAVFAILFLTCMYVPKYWRFGYYNDCLSMADMFAERYDPKLSRAFFSIVILIVFTSGVGAMLLGLNAVWGYITDLPLLAITGLSALVILAYSVSGGARGVTWTDTACLVIMVVGLFVIGARIFGVVESFDSLLTAFASVPEVEGRPWQSGQALVSLTNSFFVPSFLLTWGAAMCVNNSVTADTITRTYMAKNERVARISVAICMFIIVFTHLVTAFIAVYARVNYPALGKADFAFPSVVLDTLPEFWAAIVLIAIVAAIFSSASTLLIICGQCVGYDIYSKLIKPDATETSTPSSL